ncbi:MAG: hypothetical protein KC482_01825 [Dehalococcoidia bacterium]|nr:hypothetical protein [Dehalococcoidia bacterium]MCA9825420.1 hypothetical protein [Dehalococcoidia bacterium]MCA9845867.1 hypothetical protein [Dehalococcoidia bacterium]MCA9852334.1 hypothetical protein [Dehalococcoidia bacterium]
MATILPPLGGVGRAIPLPRPRINGWIVGGLLAAGIGAMLPVLETSVATTRGFDNQELTAERLELQGEIRQLEAELANFTSLQRIERRALNLGLVPADDPIYVEISEPGPEPARIPAGLLPQATPETAEPESWWGSLIGWLPLPD